MLLRLDTHGFPDPTFGSGGQPNTIPGVATYDYASLAFGSDAQSGFFAMALDAQQPVAFGSLGNNHGVITRFSNDAIFRDGYQ